ncbi:hypothetical protein MKW92_028714, partial [Papaver armeniacum]
MGKSRERIFDGEAMGNCTHTGISLFSFLMDMCLFLERIPSYASIDCTFSRYFDHLICLHLVVLMSWCWLDSRKAIYLQHGILNSFMRTCISNSRSQCSLSQHLSRLVFPF